MNMEIIELGNESYPKSLEAIVNPPKVLYCLGDVSLLQTEAIAIVGTRRASPYGRWAATEIARRIARAGVTVVSGMAAGIDSAGHQGCLREGGKTIAVLGTGVDVCFPKSNGALYREIAEKGLVISEFEPGTQGRPGNFPQRNRIISGLSRSTIVVEGALKSGSMITANLAAEQGRDVFAVPGNINQPNSIGVNKLIADGAVPIMDLDVLEETLGICSLKRRRLETILGAEEKKYYDIIKYNPGIQIEVLSIRTDDAPSYIAGILTVMEIKGIIRRDGNSVYINS